MNKNFLIGAFLGLLVLLPVLWYLYRPPTLVKVSKKTQQLITHSKNPIASPSAQKVPEKKDPEYDAIKNIGPGVPILMYHYVGYNPNPADKPRDTLSITPDKFETQLKWLTDNHYTPITLNTLYGIFSGQASRPTKPIVLTFDDGYVDFYFIAWPILRHFNFPAVSFIPTGLVGKSSYMTWDQIKEISNSGLVEFEAHTVNHANLPTLSYDKMVWELKTSKETLEAKTGKKVNFIAYPFGASNQLVWKAALDSGFVGGFGTWLGRAGGPGINSPRIRIVGQITMPEFISRVQE